MRLEKIGLFITKLRYVSLRGFLCKLGFHKFSYKIESTGFISKIACFRIKEGGEYECGYCEKIIKL